MIDQTSREPYPLRLSKEIEAYFAPAAIKSLSEHGYHLVEALVVPSGHLALCNRADDAGDVLVHVAGNAGTWTVTPAPVQAGLDRPAASRSHPRAGPKLRPLYDAAFDEIASMPNKCMHLPTFRKGKSLLDVVEDAGDVLALLQASTDLAYIDYVKRAPRTVLQMVSHVHSAAVFEFLLEAGADPTTAFRGFPCARQTALNHANPFAVAAYISRAGTDEELKWWERLQGCFESAEVEEVARAALLGARTRILVNDMVANMNRGLPQ